MNLHKIVIGAFVYMVWTVLTGFLVPPLLVWSVVIAALVSGIYCGLKVSSLDGAKNGFIAGLVGGISLGIVALSIPSFYGISLLESVDAFLNPFGMTGIPYLSIVVLAVAGALFGTTGGLLGSINKLRKIFLFLVLFTLFMMYLALDNVAWYLGRASVEWSMSHVLTHWVDITVSLGFAFFVVLLAHVLKIYQ
ncbi:MAG: hypothetical protein JW700_04230 [Candidatus Aenigmarchaeota archaeon]|nr:hypothetical protein [Candidatus Aenigmarchaeota archaeon]